MTAGLSYPSDESSADWARPSVYLQWKGTDVCLDFHCLCDTEQDVAGVGHFDGYGAYAIRCPRCGRVYELPSEVPLKLVETTSFEPVEAALW